MGFPTDHIRNLRRNKTDRIRVMTDRSLNLPVRIFRKVYERTPNKMPSEMDWVMGIMMIVRNAGMASVTHKPIAKKSRKMTYT